MNIKLLGLGILLLIIYFLGFGIDVMDVDASQYASMSREMLESGNYLQVYDHAKDYLDKPPFLFWISALSMKIFGVNNFAYRLPSFLFSMLTLYATYKFSLLFYAQKVALLAAVVLASSQAFFLINHDVRTDTILMSWVILSVWQLAAWYKTNKFHHFVVACIAIGGGMLTKGPIAVIVPVLAFSIHFILQGNFLKMILKWQYLLGIIIIGLVLLPMCIGLYNQFDLHPEKLVNEKTSVSGLRFFFWTQSFGRITGESVWNNGANIFFLFQNMLWAFLPWIIFFCIAFVLNLTNIIKQKFKLKEGQEFITTGGFLLSYLALGSSKYQLPHYIFVVFPFAAIITANFLHELIYESKKPKLLFSLKWIHSIMFALLCFAIPLLLFSMSAPIWLFILSFIFITIYLILNYYTFSKQQHILVISLLTICCINLFLNGFFYPKLLKYEMGSMAGRWIYKNNLQNEKVFVYLYENPNSLSFYAKRLITNEDNIDKIPSQSYVILPKGRLTDFDLATKKYEIMYEGEDFHVSGLNINFLNPTTRKNVTTTYNIIKTK